MKNPNLMWIDGYSNQKVSHLAFLSFGHVFAFKCFKFHELVTAFEIIGEYFRCSEKNETEKAPDVWCAWSTIKKRSNSKILLCFFVFFIKVLCCSRSSWISLYERDQNGGKTLKQALTIQHKNNTDWLTEISQKNIHKYAMHYSFSFLKS